MKKLKSKDMTDPKTRMLMEFFESQGAEFVDVTSEQTESGRDIDAPSKEEPSTGKAEGEEAGNPSYDKSLSLDKRLGDFLGAYHIILHGVRAHEPFCLESEGKPEKECDTEDKNRLIDFIRQLIAEERKAVVEDIRSDLQLIGYNHTLDDCMPIIKSHLEEDK